MSELLKNEVFLNGRVCSEKEFSHRIYGEVFYKFLIEVLRLSGSSDILPITASERIIANVDTEIGCKVFIHGQLRSYNMLIDNVSRLVLTVFCKKAEEIHANSSPNEIELEGYICKPATYRVTPFGREITDLLIAVNRNYNKSDYIPCIVWGRNARYVANFEVGEKVHMLGRIQARDYEKVHSGGEKEIRTAYEVSVSRIEKLQ